MEERGAAEPPAADGGRVPVGGAVSDSVPVVPAAPDRVAGAGDWVRIAAVWAFAALAGTAVLVALAPARRIDGLMIVVVSALLLTFVLQLATARSTCLIARLSLSLTGAAVVLAVLSGVSVLLGAFGQ